MIGAAIRRVAVRMLGMVYMFSWGVRDFKAFRRGFLGLLDEEEGGGL